MGDGERQASSGEERRPPAPVRTAVETVLERKGEDVRVLDMRETSSFTDYLVICSGRSERQNRAILEAVEKRLADEGIEPLNVEGRQEGTWILADYVDFVVNVFTPETREFYQLERLWRDAPAYDGAEISESPVGEAAADAPEAEAPADEPETERAGTEDEG